MSELITYDELRRILDYDRESGVFRWKVARVKARIGTEAGTVSKTDGYRYITLNRRRYLAHVLAWLYVHGYYSENVIDHCDRNILHNWIDNLREISFVCNSRNAKLSKANTSGIKGVYQKRQTGKWQAQITLNMKLCHLGYYDNFDDAVCARLAAEQCLNWNGCDSSSPAYRHVKKLQNKLFENVRV